MFCFPGAVARLEARDGELRGRLRRLALERVADAEAGGILGDDAWAEAPPSGRSSVARMRIVVVFPAPLRILCP